MTATRAGEKGVQTDDFNACDWLVDRHVAAGRGGARAFVCGDDELTYDGLLEAIHATAHGLTGLGCGPGDRVVMVVDDELAFPVVFLAAMRLGAVPVPVSTMLRPAELAPIISDSGAKVLVSSKRYAGDLAAMAGGSQLTDVVVVDGAGADVPVTSGAGEHPGGVQVHRLSHWRDNTPLPVHPTGSGDDALWLYTSGTTGRSKAAIHLHGDVRAVCETYARSVLSIGAEDVCYSVPKLFFAFGLGNALFFPLSVGASAVIDPERPTPARAAALGLRHRPTLFFAPPGFCAAMADSDVPGDVLSSARATVTAGEVLPAEVKRRFEERFGTEALDGIGSTELLHIFCSNHPGRTRRGTSGTPVAGYELKLIGDDGSEVTAPDTPGALWVRGPSVARGYWQRPELTEATFVEGWCRTGDVYSRSADGYFRFVGRNSDMVKAGGIWVSPVEVENVLLEHPSVLEAAVIGSRDAAGLETTVAFVVARREASIDVEGLLAHCRQQMAAYKRPRQVHVVGSLPRTATGKIKRFELRAMLEEADAPAPERSGATDRVTR